ncbi:MAG TPA: hypothetical protein VKV25_06385 [Acidimicrobiales bacterium]|nr:hypothetical protein [Acidimicrobiales bacterium]
MILDARDPRPHIGRAVTYALSVGVNRPATILRADPDRLYVDLWVDDGGAGVEQLGARWWTGRHAPRAAHVGSNIAWPTGLPEAAFGAAPEDWAGHLPDYPTPIAA